MNHRSKAAAGRTGYTNDCPICQLSGIIIGLLCQSIRNPDTFSSPCLKRTDNLRAIPVIFQGFAVCITVIENCSVLPDPGNPVYIIAVSPAGQMRKIFFPRNLYSRLQIPHLSPHCQLHLLLQIPAKQPGRYQSCHYHGKQGNQAHIPIDFPFHPISSIL